MNGLLAFVFLFSGSVFALDESLSLEILPLDTKIKFDVPRLEMPPQSADASICKDSNSGYQLYLRYESSPSDRYFPARSIEVALVNSIVLNSDTRFIHFCSESSKSVCAFSFKEDLKDIQFQLYLGKDRTIADLRKFVEGCGGTMTLPEPTPYP